MEKRDLSNHVELVLAQKMKLSRSYFDSKRAKIRSDKKKPLFYSSLLILIFIFVYVL